MSNLRNIYRNFFLVLILLWNYNAFANYSCEQVFPSEYAYESNSVYRSERQSANCMAYPAGGQVANVYPEHYTHCDGTKLRLTDSDLGSELYNAGDYYVWSGKKNQLLFIFPTRINLTTITLHYYHDNARGLPKLRFWAVPPYLEIWDIPARINSHVDVTAVLPGESASHRSISITLNFTTIRVLMYKYRSDFNFSLSEVEFFTRNATTITSQPTTTRPNFLRTGNQPTTGRSHLLTTDVPLGNTFTNKTYLTEHSTSQNSDSSRQSEGNFQITLAAGVTATVLLVLVLLCVLVVLLLHWYKKRTPKININYIQDGLYSTLDRGTKQNCQPQTHNVSTELYDQIQLSPSTGQSEPIFKTESENVDMFTSSVRSDYHNMETHHKDDPEKSNLEYATYAVVDKKKRKPTRDESKESQENTSEGCVLKNPENLKSEDPQNSDEVQKLRDQQSQRKENLEEMYAVVQKKPKKHGEEETAPPVPSYTVEALYTAVQKKPK